MKIPKDSQWNKAMTIIEHKEKDHTKASQPIQEEPAFTFFHTPVASSLSNSHSINPRLSFTVSTCCWQLLRSSLIHLITILLIDNILHLHTHRIQATRIQVTPKSSIWRPQAQLVNTRAAICAETRSLQMIFVLSNEFASLLTWKLSLWSPYCLILVWLGCV